MRPRFLFSAGGAPLARSRFEETLTRTDALLGDRGGPFLAGPELSAADVAWAPFLERYAAQLPLLHEGLRPRDPAAYPRLAAWYDAIEEAVPAYACRVRGDAASWARVLAQAGHGNGGHVPELLPRSDDDVAVDDVAVDAARTAARSAATWRAYEADRDHVAPTPNAEAAAAILRNRDAILADAAARAVAGDADDLENGLRAVAAALVGVLDDATAKNAAPAAAAVARYLDDRLCVPRDMGAPPAAAIRRLAASLASRAN